MNPNTGEIVKVDEKEHKQLMDAFLGKRFEDNGRGLMIPLTSEQERILTPKNAKDRKGWMRNQPCICGSQIKFKKCCWSKIV